MRSSADSCPEGEIAAATDMTVLLSSGTSSSMMMRRAIPTNRLRALSVKKGWPLSADGTMHRASSRSSRVAPPCPSLRYAAFACSKGSNLADAAGASNITSTMRWVPASRK